MHRWQRDLLLVDRHAAFERADARKIAEPLHLPERLTAQHAEACERIDRSERFEDVFCEACAQDEIADVPVRPFRAFAVEMLAMLLADAAHLVESDAHRVSLRRGWLRSS